MRGQYLLIRRLATLLRIRMSGSGHLLQAVTQEGRGNCLPPWNGCGPACQEAQELMALTEPFMRPAAVKPVRLPVRVVVLKRPVRRAETRTVQPTLFEAA